MAEKEERPDIKIDGSIATWELKAEGAIAGTYTGLFKFKCFLTPMERIRAGREYRDILGPHLSLASEQESLTAWSLTQLKYRVLQSPPFWSSQNSGDIDGNIADEDIIAKILDAAIGAEIKYKKILEGRRNEAIQRAKLAGEEVMGEKRVKKDDNEDED